MIRVLIAFFLLFTLGNASPTTSELAKDINLAGKQRMLIQRMSKEALMVALHVNEQEAKKDLKEDMKLFSRTLQGLLQGDKELGLVPVEDQKIKEAIKDLQKRWQPFKQSLEKVIDGGFDKKTIEYIKENNLDLLKRMNAIVEMYVALNKEAKIKRAQAINLAGKERMLSQKIAKDVLLVQYGYKDQAPILRKDKELFAKILHGLQKGDKKLGLEETKLPWINRELHKAQQMWQEYKKLAVPKKLSKEKLAALVQKSNLLLAQMDKITKMYEKSINREKRARALSQLVSSFEKKEQEAKHIINLAGKQRMLTQRMSKLALMDALNIDKQKTQKLLKNSYQLYDKTLRGFLVGDKELQLPPAKNEVIKKEIAKVQEVWKPFKKSVEQVLASQGKDPNALAYIIANNEELLKRSNDLVQTFKREYATYNFLEDARKEIVDIAGRQRMLTQKMTKEKMLVTLGINPQTNWKKMVATVELFDTSLKRLMYGDKKHYIIKPTNPKLVAQYKIVASLWQELKPIYLKKRNSPKELNFIIQKNPILLKEMDKAVKLSEVVLEY